MSHRFTRAARHKVKPGMNRVDREMARHHGDEFDEEVPTPGYLHVIPCRGYSPNVPQTFDEMNVAVNHEPVGRLNQLGPVIDGAIPVVTSAHDFSSYLAAFDKRSNSQPDKDDDCTDDFMKLACSLWNKVGKDIAFDSFDVDDALFERWLAKMDPPKQTRMVKAFRELFCCEDDPGYIGEKSLSVKVEALLKRYDNKWAPRLIYAGNDHFNALTGPVAMVLCERLMQIFERGRLGKIKFKMAYKANDVELASFVRDASDSGLDHIAEGDFSANDLRQRKGASVVFDHFCKVVGAPTWFRDLLKQMRAFSVRNVEFGHRAQLIHQLPTGTTITTPRNTVWNATIEAVYCQVVGNEGSGVLLGDDILMLLKRAINVTHWQNWVGEHPKMKLTGCSPKLQGEATFLSRRLLIENEDPCMMPKLGKALARFNVRTSPNEAISDSAYMAGKALSYAYEFRHFPLFRDLFLNRYRLEDDKANIDISEVSWFTRASGVNLADLESSIMAEKVLVSEDNTREFLMDAYGDTFGLVPAMEICRRVILGRDISVVDAPQELAIDW